MMRDGDGEKGGREISSWYVLVDLSHTATCVWFGNRVGVETGRVEMQVIRWMRLEGSLVPVPVRLGAFFVCRRQIDVQVSSRRTDRAQLRRQRVPAIQLAATAETALRTFASLSLVQRP